VSSRRPEDTDTEYTHRRALLRRVHLVQLAAAVVAELTADQVAGDAADVRCRSPLGRRSAGVSIHGIPRST
jgi:hypothetical protein